MSNDGIAREYTKRILALLDEAHKLYNYENGKFFYAKDYGTILDLTTEDMKKCTGIAAIHLSDFAIGFNGDHVMTDKQLYEVITADSNIRMMIRNKIRANEEKREAERLAHEQKLKEYKDSLSKSTGGSTVSSN